MADRSIQKLSFRHLLYILTVKKKKFNLKFLFHWLHLWVGLICGIIVFIVAITGCLYSFKDEITSILDSHLIIKTQNKPLLKPFVLKKRAEKYIFLTQADSANKIYGVSYEKNKAASIAYSHYEKGYSTIYLNPYTGNYIDKKHIKKGFFPWVLSGHRSLWLPYKTGHLIVGWATFLFVITTLSGLILWWPKKWKKKHLNSAFKVKWNARFFRLNYDLHNVLGFYTCIFALIIAVTGLNWSFQWFSHLYYGIISGGQKIIIHYKPPPDESPPTPHADSILWEKVLSIYPINKKGVFIFDYPSDNDHNFRIGYNPDTKNYYRREFKFYNSSEIQEIQNMNSLYSISYEKSSYAQKLYRMNYDIHIGSIAGITGKIIVFLISLILASLPVTGCIIWWKKGFRMP